MAIANSFVHCHRNFGIDSFALAQVHFLSEDPRQFMEGANLYAYVLGNPVQFTDHLGLATFCEKVRAICLAVMCYVTGSTPPRIEITPPRRHVITGSKDPKK
ncbi:RHS repeat-associated core domain-containing protein [Bradyrhizobium sp. UFLA05-112]